jgi:hypothetical protein
MKKINLKNHCTIKGIAAPSGLLYTQNVLFIISDSSSFLYQYDLKKEVLLKFPLLNDAKENITKAEKLDLESITQHGNQLLLFGSGSTPQRNTMFTLHLENDTLQSQDLSTLYQKLREVGSLSDQQLNIEGAIYAHNTMLLFQRGNSKNGKNGIFIIPNQQEEALQFIPLALPSLDDVETTFTDAILVGETIYFLASAEKTDSTYDDGVVLGSILGIMHAPTFEIIEIHLISEDQKFEGITLYNETASEIEFLLCEDNDTESIEAKIYTLTLLK